MRRKALGKEELKEKKVDIWNWFMARHLFMMMMMTSNKASSVDHARRHQEPISPHNYLRYWSYHWPTGSIVDTCCYSSVVIVFFGGGGSLPQSFRKLPAKMIMWNPWFHLIWSLPAAPFWSIGHRQNFSNPLCPLLTYNNLFACLLSRM